MNREALLNCDNMNVVSILQNQDKEWIETLDVSLLCDKAKEFKCEFENFENKLPELNEGVISKRSFHKLRCNKNFAEPPFPFLSQPCVAIFSNPSAPPLLPFVYVVTCSHFSTICGPSFFSYVLYDRLLKIKIYLFFFNFVRSFYSKTIT